MLRRLPLRTLTESCTFRAVIYLMAAEFRCAFHVSTDVEIDQIYLPRSTYSHGFASVFFACRVVCCFFREADV